MPRQSNDLASMPNLNSNLLCAIAIQTTGKDPFRHDICQIAVIPVNYEIKRMRGVEPFFADIKPRYPDEIDYNDLPIPRERLLDISNHGVDQVTAEGALERWFDNNPAIGDRKKVIPLCYNWSFMQPFLYRWLGLTFKYVFDYRIRDVLPIANFINDYSWQHVDPFPFQKVDFPYLCSSSKVEREHGRFKDSLTECMALIDLYRDICLGRIRIIELIPAYNLMSKED